MAAGDPILDLSDLVNLATGGNNGTPEQVNWHKRASIAGAAPGTLVVGRQTSLWKWDGLPGASVTSPTTSAVCTNATAGAMRQASSASGRKKRLLSVAYAQDRFGLIVVYDRLVEQGGLSGTTTGAQTTNLPTSALTRYTSGVGVEAWIETYTQVGASSTTLTISYTDDAGNTGNTSQAIAFGNTGFREQDRQLLVPLASGDRGVRAVASVTIAATTGTAGAFGVTLAYPLLTLRADAFYNTSNPGLLSGRWSGISVAGGPLDLGANSDACLALAYIPILDTVAPTFFGDMFFLEK